jgi:hypothetical protein
VEVYCIVIECDYIKMVNLEGKKMNKKGQYSDLKKAFISIALILIGVLICIWIVNKFNFFKDDTFTGDFDGDNKENTYGSDMFDPCPCGYDNVKQKTTTGLFCVASYTPTQCDCANELSNKAMQKDKDTKVTKAMFIKSGDKCLYDKEEACKYLIMGNPNFNTELLTTPNACPALATT